MFIAFIKGIVFVERRRNLNHFRWPTRRSIQRPDGCCVACKTKEELDQRNQAWSEFVAALCCR
jgi:hypothetical protein